MNQIIDREIEQMVRRFLDNDPRIDTSEIDVRVEGGTVYLTGAVDSAAERHAIQEDIQAAADVEGIVNQLRLRNFVERSDEELVEEVKHALIRDISVDADPIKVVAKGGEVVLSGCVETLAQKNAAEDIAWWTPGVTDVISHLEIEETGKMPEDMNE